MTLIELLSKILDIAFSGFWAFWGITILLAMAIGVLLAPIGLLFRCWNRVFRHLNIKSQGWPPEHCDADGDFKNESKDG